MYIFSQTTHDLHTSFHCQLLLAFNDGLVVLWNLLTRQVIHRHQVGTQKLLTSLCWISSGKEFATSYYDGAIGVWNLKSDRGPENLFYPHGTYLVTYIHLHNIIVSCMLALL